MERKEGNDGRAARKENRTERERGRRASRAATTWRWGSAHPDPQVGPDLYPVGARQTSRGRRCGFVQRNIVNVNATSLNSPDGEERQFDTHKQTETARGRLKMILRAAPGGIVLLLALIGLVGAQDDDSLASTFLSGRIWKDATVLLLEVAYSAMRMMVDSLAVTKVTRPLTCGQSEFCFFITVVLKTKT
ncbi:hypothetical protein DBV15_11765 [Temnothorax longispinosus]|uniref:Uncharacterized protein n=1 Tax=Temnothorax longispinosus TaxID=300112 RepID=A0A4S2KQ21_9HYME|nr:hypothetical protein DBV15_11765 [Temnothorax longispinosus]